MRSCFRFSIGTGSSSEAWDGAEITYKAQYTIIRMMQPPKWRGRHGPFIDLAAPRAEGKKLRLHETLLSPVGVNDPLLLCGQLLEMDDVAEGELQQRNSEKNLNGFLCLLLCLPPSPKVCPVFP